MATVFGAWEFTWRPFDGSDPIPFFVVAVDQDAADKLAWLMVALARANVNH